MTQQPSSTFLVIAPSAASISHASFTTAFFHCGTFEWSIAHIESYPSLSAIWAAVMICCSSRPSLATLSPCVKPNFTVKTQILRTRDSHQYPFDTTTLGLYFKSLTAGTCIMHRLCQHNIFKLSRVLESPCKIGNAQCHSRDAGHKRRR